MLAALSFNKPSENAKCSAVFSCRNISHPRDENLFRSYGQITLSEGGEFAAARDINTRLGVPRLVDGHNLIDVFVLGCIFGSIYINAHL